MKYLALVIEPHKSHRLQLEEFHKHFIGTPSFMATKANTEYHFINTNFYSFVIRFCEVLCDVVGEKWHEEFIGSIPFGLSELIAEYPEKITRKILDNFLKELKFTFGNSIRIESRQITFRGLKVLNCDRTTYLVKTKTPFTQERCKELHIRLRRVKRMKKKEYRITYISERNNA